MSSSEVLPSAGSPPGAPATGRPRRWLRRLLWSVLAVVVALALVFFAGGGWYFAGQIRSEALAVEPGTALPAYTDARVVGVAPGLIRLRAIGSQPALFKPELDGIAWRGGIGHLGASVAVSGGVVTRPLTVVSGSAPRVGQLAASTRPTSWAIRQRRWASPCRTWSCHGPLGPLPAWYFPGRGSTFVIGVHGQNSTRKSLLRVVSIVHRLGFPALAVTYRNDLGVARDPSGYLRYGADRVARPAGGGAMGARARRPARRPGRAVDGRRHRRRVPRALTAGAEGDARGARRAHARPAGDRRLRGRASAACR